ncbi:hypothetical protein [Variovorax paradoxus]|uniref:hypothetical protein n=1 Tax=Variovorax paradoxus TaxID=34073 RepID=UPI003D649CF3
MSSKNSIPLHMNSTTSSMTLSLKIYACAAAGVMLLVIGSFFWVLSTFGVREIPNSISYDVTVPAESVEILFKNISTAVAQIGLRIGKNKEANDFLRNHWSNDDESQGVTWDFSGDGRVHISIFSMVAGSDESFLNMVSSVQGQISAWPEGMKSHLQLAPERFGACASRERPEVKDSTCIYERKEVFDLYELKQLLQSHPVR